MTLLRCVSSCVFVVPDAGCLGLFFLLSCGDMSPFPSFLILVCCQLGLLAAAVPVAGSLVDREDFDLCFSRQDSVLQPKLYVFKQSRTLGGPVWEGPPPPCRFFNRQCPPLRFESKAIKNSAKRQDGSCPRTRATQWTVISQGLHSATADGQRCYWTGQHTLCPRGPATFSHISIPRDLCTFHSPGECSAAATMPVAHCITRASPRMRSQETVTPNSSQFFVGFPLNLIPPHCPPALGR